MVSSPQTELYFIRHGIAAERGTYENDDERPLTDAGQARTQAIAQRLLALGCQVDWVLSSPLVRAQQTTQILLEAGIAPTVETTHTLSPVGQLQAWLPWLDQWQREHPISRVALVGHEPNLSEWAQQLVTGRRGDRWKLKKAGVIGVKAPAAVTAIGHSELFWLTPPRLLL